MQPAATVDPTPPEDPTTLRISQPAPAEKSAVSAAEPAQGTHNISSDTLARDEVTKIAEQLRQRLDTSKDDTAKADSDVLAAAHMNQVAKGDNSSNQQSAKDDSIFIDADGVFHQSEA